MSNAFGFGKQSMETAIAMEKVASKINGKEWHELSALMNMKYRLDKLAEEITNGNYLYNAEPVFAKVAELKPVIEKKASDLIDFNRKQLLRTSSYIVEPELVKQALHQLDELSVYAGEVKKKEKMTKEAGIFRNSSKLSNARKAAANLEGNVNKLKTKFDNSHAKLRASLHMNGQGDKVDKAFNKAVDTQRQYQDGSKNLQDALHAAGDIKQKESSKNMAIAAGVGLPGLAGLGYAYQSEKNKKK
jgi:hypothetical protein